MNATQWFLFVILPLIVGVIGVGFGELLRWQNLKRKTAAAQSGQKADDWFKSQPDLPDRLAQATSDLERLIQLAKRSGRLSQT
jgi:hypothetical protein